jgi:hypothetical protein
MNYIAPEAFVSDEIYRIYTIFSLIWPECHVPECSADKLQMGDMPGDCGSDLFWSRATAFFFTVWLQRERCEALQTVAIMGHVSVQW